MKIKYVSIGLIFLILACGEKVSVVDVNDDNIDRRLSQLIVEAINNSYDQMPGGSMSIISPDLPQGSWSGTAGYDSRDKEDSLSIDQPYRIASLTKTFVAASILRLHEMDSLSIDDPISNYISQRHIDILKQDDYDPDKILIRHCLNHTSGLFDYATNHDKYIETCTQNPDKRWTRTEQLEGAVKWGEKQGEPGDRYLYCDTGFILLGEIIEKFASGDLADGMRSLLKFEHLGLKSTWLESLEPERSNTRHVRRYLGRLDATNWDPSVDLYGGGGLMSTSPDLARFINGLFNNKVFDKAETLQLMMSKPQYAASYIPDDDNRFKDYRYGFWEINIYGKKAYMHSGLWGTTFLHIPESNLSIAANITKGHNDRMIKKAVLAINNLKLQ